jgi:hypothetical protein
VRGALIVGAIGGLAGAVLELLAMFTDLPYAAWDRANVAIVGAFSVALVVLAVRHGRRRRADARLLAPVVAAALLCNGIGLLTYAVATGPFAGEVHQLPFFANDPTYQRYPSALMYLSMPGNYGALFRLQLFSTLIVVLLQVALGGTAAAAASVRRGRGARTRTDEAAAERR